MSCDSGRWWGGWLAASGVCCGGETFRISSGVPRKFILGWGGSTNSVEDRQNGDLEDGSPLVRGSGGCCNLVQEILIHIVKFSIFLVLQDYL